MLFLSVIIFGVIKLQTSNLTLSNTKQLELKAYTYATQGMEIVSALDYDTQLSVCSAPCYLVNAGGYSILSGDYEDPEEGEPGAGMFQRSFSHDGTDLTDALLVTMTVAWTDSSGNHDVSVKRIIAK